MNHRIHLKVSGDYALFTRPEMKVEHVSYDVMTPSAARGVLEAIYWKPQIRWIVDEIHVLNPIRFTNIRRNEVSSKIAMKGPSGVLAAMATPSLRPSVSVSENRQQRASLLLKEVAYLITAHFVILDASEEKGEERLARTHLIRKHLGMFKRRARRGQAFHQPYLGCREFPTRFELIQSNADRPSPHESLTGERDLGLMLHYIEFDQDRTTKRVRSTTPHFFPAKMLDGVIRVPELPFPLKA